jgi:hypothetical protein
LISSSAAALISSAATLISAAAILSGIPAIIIVVLAFAVVEANALLPDGDAFLVSACVKGRTDQHDRSCKQRDG